MLGVVSGRRIKKRQIDGATTGWYRRRMQPAVRTGVEYIGNALYETASRNSVTGSPQNALMDTEKLWNSLVDSAILPMSESALRPIITTMHIHRRRVIVAKVRSVVFDTLQV